MAFVDDHALIMKDVPATIVPTLKTPKSLAPVVPTVILLRKISELAVTDVVDTVAVPFVSVTEPNELAPAAAVVPTFELTILFPGVLKTRFPVKDKFPVVARLTQTPGAETN